MTGVRIVRPVVAGQDRVGIVVPIPEPEASRLVALRSRLGDEFAMVPPHVTLVTGVPVTDWNMVVDHVAAVAAAAQPFTIEFEGTDTFRPVTPVVFYQVLAGRSECSRLHTALQAGPLALPSAYPYVPHVTLAQGLDDAVLDQVQEALSQDRWTLQADRISLFGDVSDNDWKLRATFPLGAS